MKYHTYKIPKGHKSLYKQKAAIHRVMFLYPDNTYSHEIKPCVWNEGTPQERKGYPACMFQLVCPFVSCQRHDHEQNPLGKCNNECLDPQMREAIEAWVTLNPTIC